MADLKKFLDHAGVGTLWGKVVEKINAEVAAEAALAREAERVNAAAAKAADDKAVAADNKAQAITDYVGTFTASEGVDTVIKYIDKKTTGIATDAALQELRTAVNGHSGDIDRIEDKVDGVIEDYLTSDDKTELETAIGVNETAIAGITADYLKGADKTELSNAIALKADQTALEAVSAVANAAVKQTDYDAKMLLLDAEDERIAGLIATEQDRAEGVEAGLDSRLVEVEAFFKLAEGEKLDTALDTLVELQNYLESEGAVADQMLLDIAKNATDIKTNADDIKAIADDYLKDEDKTALEGAIALKADITTVNGIDTRLTTAEGDIDKLEAWVEGHKVVDHDFAAADAALESKLNAEIAKKAVASEVTAEFAAVRGEFATADNAVKDLIAAEAATRTSEDEALDAKISAMDTAYKAADQSLDARLTIVEGNVGTGGSVDSKIEAAQTAAQTYAKNYADGLAVNYATAAQGKKADSAVQSVTVAESAAGVMELSVDGTVYQLFAAMSTSDIEAAIAAVSGN